MILSRAVVEQQATWLPTVRSILQSGSPEWFADLR